MSRGYKIGPMYNEAYESSASLLCEWYLSWSLYLVTICELQPIVRQI